MRFIYNDQIIIMHRSEIILHRIRSFSRFFASQMTRIVFNSFAHTCRFNHFKIKFCTLFKAIVLYHPILLLIIGETLTEFLFDTFDS